MDFAAESGHIARTEFGAPSSSRRRQTEQYEIQHMLLGSEIADQAVGAFSYSALRGPQHSFQFRLKVYPAGTPNANNSLSVFIELVPPLHLAHTLWECLDVCYCITVSYTSGGRKTVHKQDCFSFTKAKIDRGWHDMVSRAEIQEESDWRQNALFICGKVWLPYFSAAIDMKPVDFATEPKCITFRLGDGSTLFFDQRILTIRSEYFSKMFAETPWQESITQEVDLTCDPHADRTTMSAVLHYLMTGQVMPFADLDALLSLRRLADQFCLPQLVLMVEEHLQALLSKESVLTILGHVVGSGGQLETLCTDMLTANSFALLEQQKGSLDQVIESNPELVKAVMQLLLKSARGASIESPEPSASS